MREEIEHLRHRPLPEVMTQRTWWSRAKSVHDTERRNAFTSPAPEEPLRLLRAYSRNDSGKGFPRQNYREKWLDLNYNIASQSEYQDMIRCCALELLTSNQIRVACDG